MPYETHWTEYGSTAFIEALVGRFSPELALGPLVRIGFETKAPDLGRMAGMYFMRDFPRIRIDRGGYQNRNSNQITHSSPGRPFVHNISTSDGAPLSPKRILFLHDSFMYIAWDQVSQVFEDTLYMHWIALTPETFATLASSADIVVIQTVERETFVRLAEFFATDALAAAVLATTQDQAAEGEAIWPRQKTTVGPAP